MIKHGYVHVAVQPPAVKLKPNSLRVRRRGLAGGVATSSLGDTSLFVLNDITKGKKIFTFWNMVQRNKVVDIDF